MLCDRERHKVPKGCHSPSLFFGFPLNKLVASENGKGKSMDSDPVMVREESDHLDLIADEMAEIR